MYFSKKLTLQVQTSYGTRTEYLDASQISQIVGVSKASAYRWINQPGSISDSVRQLLEFKALGLIPDVRFDGWSVRNGKLISAIGLELTPCEIENIAHAYLSARVMYREMQHQNNAISRLKKRILRNKQTSQIFISK